jgi:signal transduction histidine kinase
MDTMYWLYFARDFYRTGGTATARKYSAEALPAPALPEHTPPAAAPRLSMRAHRVTFSHSAVVAVVAPAIAAAQSTATRKKRPSAAKRQQSYAVRSAPVAPGAPDDAPSPLMACLQRLSIDGDHAFGLWDEEVGFSLFSANFERVTGLLTGECAGHDWIHQIHHNEQYAVNEALLNACDGRDGQCLVQAGRLKEDAEKRWLRMDVRAPRAGQPTVMVLFRDMTDLKALEEALEQTKQALTLSDRGRAAFLSSMSHELRTPLNAIMGFSEMMKSGVFGDLNNPTYREYADHIHQSGSALLSKINDLLDIASMDDGGLALEMEPFALRAMLEEAIAIHSHHAFSRQQQITLDCPYTMNMEGDRAKLICAVSHLISNALRHSPEGAAVQLSIRPHADEGIIISVRDAGEGIAPGQLEIIRAALDAPMCYFKIENGGIGLGLSLTKELTQRHGGRVIIDSMRHRGTVVSLFLPRERVLSGMPARRAPRNA